MKTQIVEVVTLIKQTREEAITLAYEIGGGEVHALHIQRGLGMPAEQPVGYLVKPLKPRQWQRLTDEELWELWNSHTEQPFPEWFVDFKRAYKVIAEKLKEKNT